MARVLEIDYTEFEELNKLIEEYEGNVGPVIETVLNNEASELFMKDITRLMPVSDKKKGRHAKNSNSLRAELVPAELAIVIRSKTAFNYLYFPDDGTNTKRHVGNQQFFARGVENETNNVVDRIVNRLVEEFK